MNSEERASGVADSPLARRRFPRSQDAVDLAYDRDPASPRGGQVFESARRVEQILDRRRERRERGGRVERGHAAELESGSLGREHGQAAEAGGMDSLARPRSLAQLEREPSGLDPGGPGGWRSTRAVIANGNKICAPRQSASYATRAGSRFPIGATVAPGRVNFCIFGRHATRMELLLYAAADRLPNRKDKEFHVVVRSGAAGLGDWQGEWRRLISDYRRYMGEPPSCIARVWLIACSVFQRRRGTCDYEDILLHHGSRTTRLL